MANQLQPTIRAYLMGGNVNKRYVRVNDIESERLFNVEEIEQIAIAAGALYKSVLYRFLLKILKVTQRVIIIGQKIALQFKKE